MTLPVYSVSPALAPIQAPTPHEGRAQRLHIDAECLRNSWYRVQNFETRRPGESLQSPPRTIGQVCLLLDPHPLHTDGIDAVTICRRFQRHPLPAGAAHGKVVFLSPEGDSHVYQADPDRGAASLATCGNASAASAAFLASYLGTSTTTQHLQTSDGPVRSRSRATPVGESLRVEQTWTGINFAARQVTMLDYSVVICTGTLNDYLLVELPTDHSLEAFGLDAALALWAEARQQFGLADPLRGRLAALSRRGDTPQVKFFTSGRAHPGAPLTGLATLALATQHLPSIHALLAGGRVAHPRGEDQLPQVRINADRTEVDLQAVEVYLSSM